MLKDTGLIERSCESLKAGLLLEGWWLVRLSGCMNMAELGNSLMGKLWAGRLAPPLLMLTTGTGTIISHG